MKRKKKQRVSVKQLKNNFVRLLCRVAPCLQYDRRLKKARVIRRKGKWSYEDVKKLKRRGASAVYVDIVR